MEINAGALIEKYTSALRSLATVNMAVGRLSGHHIRDQRRASLLLEAVFPDLAYLTIFCNEQPRDRWTVRYRDKETRHATLPKAAEHVETIIRDLLEKGDPHGTRQT